MFPHPWLLVGAILALALVYVLLPLAIFGLWRFRERLLVRCPETGDRALVQVSRRSALLSELRPGRYTLRSCSLWPGRRSCKQGCMAGTGSAG